MVHSVLDVLVSHVMDAFQAGFLRVCQHNVPNGVAHVAQPIGNAEPQAMDRVGVNLQRNIAERSRGLKPLVKFNSVLHRALGGHPAPFEGPRCPRWSEESGSSPSFLSRSLCTICSNSLLVSPPSLSESFPKGWHCSRPIRTPCDPKRHDACPRGGSSSCSLFHMPRPHCSPWWGVCAQPHRSLDSGLSSSRGHWRGSGSWLQWQGRCSPAWHREVQQQQHPPQHANTAWCCISKPPSHPWAGPEAGCSRSAGRSPGDLWRHRGEGWSAHRRWPSCSLSSVMGATGIHHNLRRVGQKRPHCQELAQLKRLGHFSLRSRINCWVPSPFRGSCGWISIPIYHLLASHTMQPVNQIASDVTRKHGKKQHDKSDDLSTVYPNLSSVVEVHFFNSKGWDFLG